MMHRLMIALPKDWPISAEAFENEDNDWPVRWLKKIGRLPHQNNTWIGWVHTIPNGNPVQTIADTQFSGVILLPSVLLPDEFYKLRTKDGNTIRFYGIVPLHQTEMDLKLNTSLEALEAKLEQHNIDILLDKRRANLVSTPSLTRPRIARFSVIVGLKSAECQVNAGYESSPSGMLKR